MTSTAAAARLPVERWFATIAERRSRRSYDGRPVSDDTLKGLQDHLEAFRPFPSARASLVPDAGSDLYRSSADERTATMGKAGLFAGIAGSYARVDGAPSALVFIGQDHAPGVPEQVGYVGQAAVLEATALGLGTCWIAGLFSPAKAAQLARLLENERVYAVSPLGRPADRLSGKERLFFRSGGSRRRRPLEHIALGLATKDWPSWALAGVRAAQLAPSAQNRQPWRFRVAGSDVVLSFDGPESAHISKRLDCGIAMLHFELGVRHFGRSGSWELPPTRPEDEGTHIPGLRVTDVARWHPSR